MNEILNKQNFLLKIQNITKKNYKLLISLVAILLLSIVITQIYFYYENKQILKTSIIFNEIKSSNVPVDFEKTLNELSKKNNFYSVLASIEKIQIKLDNNKINAANAEYVNLLSKKNLNSIYKAAIAIHASYNLLNKVKKYENEIDISKKINNFLTFIDPSLVSYLGFKLEIKYLLSVIEQDMNGDIQINDKTNKLYNEIISNEKISPSLKERVKKIHEFQKYK